MGEESHGPKLKGQFVYLLLFAFIPQFCTEGTLSGNHSHVLMSKQEGGGHDVDNRGFHSMSTGGGHLHSRGHVKWQRANVYSLQGGAS